MMSLVLHKKECCVDLLQNYEQIAVLTETPTCCSTAVQVKRSGFIRILLLLLHHDSSCSSCSSCLQSRPPHHGAVLLVVVVIKFASPKY